MFGKKNKKLKQMHNRQKTILRVGVIHKELKDIKPPTLNIKIIITYLNVYVYILNV